MKINITTDEGEVIDIIDLEGWDWRKPVGGAVLVGRIKEALGRAEEAENGACDWCGSGINTLIDVDDERVCQDCLDNSK